ncbi:MAG: ABC transporter permease [Thermodesulfobacteriota bacterium]|nr:ABC transporter permease [Thermodesulfobacteriota bacterium]
MNSEALDTPFESRLTRSQEFWRLFRQNRLAIAGLVIFIVFFLTAIAGLILTSGQDSILDPASIRLQEKLLPPMSKANTEALRPDEIPALGIYLLGTDDLGRDVFARMLQGAWVSLTVGFVAVGISILVGIFMGGIAGYFGENHIRLNHILMACLFFTGAGFLSMGSIWTGLGFICALLVDIFCWLYFRKLVKRDAMPGWLSALNKSALSVDTFIMRIVDIMLCFPSFFLILTVVALLPASIYNIMIVIGLTSWMGTTRFVRAEFLSLREQDFVTAARALGVNNFRIIFRHMMPNAVAPVLVSATIGIATAILTEAGLSFLGFGVPPPHATWGNILSDGKRFIFDAPWLTFIPGIAILLVVLSFNLFGEGLRDTINPRLRER